MARRATLALFTAALCASASALDAACTEDAICASIAAEHFPENCETLVSIFHEDGPDEKLSNLCPCSCAPEPVDANEVPAAEQEEVEIEYDSSTFKSEEEFAEFKKEQKNKKKKDKMDGDVYCGMDDCFEIIGLTRAATPKEVKKVYRKLSKLWHPDKNKQNGISKEEATKTFARLGRAYGVVGDERKRADYEYYLDHPEERVGKSWDYYAPEMDVRYVLVMTLVMAQLVQYLLLTLNYSAAVTSWRNNPQVRTFAKKAAAGAKSGGKSKKAAGGGKKKVSKEEAVDAWLDDKLADAEFCAENGLTAPDSSMLMLVRAPLSLVSGATYYGRRMVGAPLSEAEKEAACFSFLEAVGTLDAHGWGQLPAAEKAALVAEDLWSEAGQAAWSKAREEEMRLKKPTAYKRYQNWRKTITTADPSFSDFLKEYKKKPADLGPQVDE